MDLTIPITEDGDVGEANACPQTREYFLPITGMFILRCVGIVVFPLGAILGYF